MPKRFRATRHDPLARIIDGSDRNVALLDEIPKHRLTVLDVDLGVRANPAVNLADLNSGKRLDLDIGQGAIIVAAEIRGQLFPNLLGNRHLILRLVPFAEKRFSRPQALSLRTFSQIGAV